MDIISSNPSNWSVWPKNVKLPKIMFERFSYLLPWAVAPVVAHLWLLTRTAPEDAMLPIDPLVFLTRKTCEIVNPNILTEDKDSTNLNI